MIRAAAPLSDDRSVSVRARSASRPITMTVAPSFARTVVIAAPIPRAPPVTMPTLSVRVDVVILLDLPSGRFVPATTYRQAVREARASVLHVQAAVDGVNRAGDVRRVVVDQKAHDTRDLVRPSEPALRNALDDFIERGFGKSRNHFGFDEPRRDAVDRDAALRHLERQALAKPEETRFRGSVIRLPDIARLADD